MEKPLEFYGSHDVHTAAYRYYLILPGSLSMLYLGSTHWGIMPQSSFEGSASVLPKTSQHMHLINTHRQAIPFLLKMSQHKEFSPLLLQLYVEYSSYLCRTFGVDFLTWKSHSCSCVCVGYPGSQFVNLTVTFHVSLSYILYFISINHMSIYIDLVIRSIQWHGLSLKHYISSSFDHFIGNNNLQWHSRLPTTLLPVGYQASVGVLLSCMDFGVQCSTLIPLNTDWSLNLLNIGVRMVESSQSYPMEAPMYVYMYFVQITFCIFLWI